MAARRRDVPLGGTPSARQAEKIQRSLPLLAPPSKTIVSSPGLFNRWNTLSNLSVDDFCRAVARLRQQRTVAPAICQMGQPGRAIIRQRIRAERRAGELLKETKENGQRKSDGGRESQLLRGTAVAPSLDNLGITRDQSSKWQRLADVPQVPHFLFSREPHYRAVGCCA